MMNVTYSPSLTLPLTRACINRCLYCGYREEGDGLLPERAIRKLVERAHHEGISEILVLSGEKADRTPKVQRDLERLGMVCLVSWAQKICEDLLKERLLPHVNIGTLEGDSLERLRDVSASMGLMLEGMNPEVNAHVHRGKDIQERIKMIERAGELKIPFTTGILMGVGERQEDRVSALRVLANIQRKSGHLQEVILQRYAVNPQSQIAPQEISFEEMKEIILFCKTHLPGVSIQVPPNLEPYWEALLAVGVNDLGGMGPGLDLVNPESPWPGVEVLADRVARRGGVLKKRLPIYLQYYEKGWFSEKLGRVLETWIEGDDGYSYYSQRSVPGEKTLS
jgi:7,8-didemethyl-8-hydroxy-5-deazariboflavin synthase CofG subunit